MVKVSDNLPKLPRRDERKQDLQKNLVFRQSYTARPVRTGVAERKLGAELDKQLQIERFRNESQRNWETAAIAEARPLPQVLIVNLSEVIPDKTETAVIRFGRKIIAGMIP